MTVLFLCNLHPGKLGAFEAFLAALGERLRGVGDKLVVAFAGPPSSVVRGVLEGAGVEWTTIPGWDVDGVVHPWAVLGPGLRIFRREQPDVVAVHFGNELPTLALILAAAISVRKPIRWIWHQRQRIEEARTWIQRHVSRIRLLSAGGCRLVALYDGGRRSMLERGVPPGKIEVIHNGVTAESCTAESRRAIRSALGVSDPAVAMVNVSGLIPRKRVDVCLRAFAAAGASPAGERMLVLVGTGPEEAALRRLADELGIMGRVRFAGRRDDVGELLAACDMLVLSSEAEAEPLAVLQAMAAGLPCVITDAGAARELIEDGRQGFVVPPGDVAAMADRIGQLAHDAGLRTSMGGQARGRWRERFRLETMVASHERLYRGVTGDVGGGRWSEY